MREIYRRLAQSPGSSLTALGVLLSVATAVLFFAGAQARYADRIAAAKSDALSFANILAEHTVLIFEDVDRALGAGMNAHVAKPFDGPRLLSMIGALIRPP